MATAIVQDADKIQCTLKFTMSLADWKRVKATLQTNTAYAEIQVLNEINDLISQLEKTYYSTVDK